MSKMQDDLDTTKYMFLRAITLLSVYTLPLYVGLWWVAGPFISVVYGEKWIAVSEPMRILLLMGVSLNILGPCGVVLDAQNRLSQEMLALGTRLVITIVGIFFGVRWGLSGVAWALLFAALFSTVHYYLLVSRVIKTTSMDLFRALRPALLLGALLFVCLAAIDKALGGERSTHPVVYLLLMTMSGAVVYSSAFLFLPIKAIASETQRWRQVVNSTMRLILRANTNR
jgi:O-antigen/teichoic acid export membrane protein